MHRLIALCAAFCFLLAGCGSIHSRPLLWYQESLTEITLRDGDTVWRMTPVPGGFTAEILAPDSVAGIVLTVTDTAAQAGLGEVQIPVSEAITGQCCQLFSLLCLTEETLIGLEAPGEDPEGISRARFRQSNAEITLGLRPDGLPAFFDITTHGITRRILVSDIRWSDDSE